MQEKIDGSIIKIWWSDEEDRWIISTNGAIFASRVEAGNAGRSFADLVYEAIETRGPTSYFFNSLFPGWTYTFELVGPFNRVVIDYPEPKLYFIGLRRNDTLKEADPKNSVGAHYAVELLNYVDFPTSYSLKNLQDCIEAAAQMSKDEEGFVVRDAAFNRIKVKSPEYLIAAKVRNNGVITVRRVIELMRAEKLDDFLAYAPQYTSFVKNILSTIEVITEAFNDSIYQLLRLVGADSASFNQPYLWIKQLPKQYQPFLFKVMQGKVANAREYVDGLRVSVLVDLIQQYEDCQF